MRFWTKSLMWRLVISFLLLSLVAVGLVSSLAYYLASEALKESVFERLEAVSTAREDDLNYWVDSQRQEVEYLAGLADVRLQAQTLLMGEPSDPSYKQAYNTLRSYLANVVTSKSDLQEIFLLNSEGGKVILSTDSSQEGQYRVDDTYFLLGRQSTYVQNVYLSPVSGKPAMTIATPLLDPQSGQFLGVLVAHLNLERLNTIIRERTGLGQSGETYLVDRGNTFVSAARFGTDEFPRGVHSTGIDAAVQGQAGRGLYKNYKEVPVIGVYRWIEQRELALVAEMHESEALAPAGRLAGAMVGLGLASVALLAIGVYWLAGQIVQPILAIADTATRVAGGDLELSAPVVTQDEIGTLALAFNKMTGQLRTLYTNLEGQVTQRTSELQRRLRQIAIGADISHTASQELDPDRLLQRVVDMICEQFDYYYTAIFLVDKEGRYAVLHAGTGEAGRIMLERNHKLEVGGKSMVGWTCANRQARIALDVGDEPVRFANPLLPRTRSEMALPLRVGERVIGALDIQSEHARAFDQDDITALQGMADQVAVALENARLFHEAQSNLQELERANRLLTEQGWRDFLRTRPPDFAEFHQPESAPLTIQEVDDIIQSGQPGRQASVMCVPLKIRGQPVGSLVAERSAGQAEWRAADYALLEAIAIQVTQSIDSTRLFEASQRQAARERLLSEITARIRESLDVELVLKTAVREISQSLGLVALDVHLNIPPPGGDADSQVEASSTPEDTAA